MAESLERLLEGMSETLTRAVAPALGDDYARGQALGVAALLDQLRERVQWRPEPLAETARAQAAGFDELRRLVDGRSWDLPSIPTAPDPFPESTDALVALARAYDEAAVSLIHAIDALRPSLTASDAAALEVWVLRFVGAGLGAAATAPYRSGMGAATGTTRSSRHPQGERNMATNTLLTDDEVFAATRRCIEAWNTLDLEATLATYSDDVVYRDPGTIGRIEGKADLRRYLTKFFKVWSMQFRVLEDRRIAGADAQICLWEADISRAAGRSRTITLAGMDIIHVRDGLLTRDEAFMDRLPLEELLRET